MATVDDVVEGRRPGLSDLGLGAMVTLALLLATWLAHRVGEARHRAVERSKSFVDAIASISAPGRAIGSTDFEAITRLVEPVGAILHADRVGVFAFDPVEPQSMSLVAASRGLREFVGCRFDSACGLPSKARSTARPVVVHDCQAIDRPADKTALGMRGAIAVPLHWGGQLRGVLCAGTTDPCHRFDVDDIEMCRGVASLAELALEQAHMRRSLERTLRSGIEALAAAVDARDQYTATHSDEVVSLAAAVGARLGLGDGALEDLKVAAKLHDVGKLAIPDSILNHAGPLSPRQWDIMRQHSVIGQEIIARVPGLERIGPIVRSEHEHWDGSGYPDAIAGRQIPLESRIILCCDAFHAMTSDRPYRSALPHESAVRELIESSGRQFDPDVVAALVAVVDPVTEAHTAAAPVC